MNNLAEQYSRFTDRELAAVLISPQQYTPEALAVAQQEADERGGIEVVLNNARAEEVHQKALRRATKEIQSQVKAGTTEEELITAYTSQGFSREEIEEIVHAESEKHAQEVYEKTETFRSIVMSLIGGVVATVAGTIYNVFFIFGGRAIFYILLLGQLLLCGGIIYLMTGRKGTTMVWIMTIISFIVSFYLGARLTGFGGIIP